MKLNCRECGEEFEKSPRCRYQYYCSNSCNETAYRKRHPQRYAEKLRNAHKRLVETGMYLVRLCRRFHVTVEWRDKKLREQNGVCAICKRLVDLHIDHDHSCCATSGESCGGCVRGLLCGLCNRMLGSVRDQQSTLFNAIEYLRKYEKKEEKHGTNKRNRRIRSVDEVKEARPQ